MGAIVAKALNSSLGTEEFKGFDQFLADNVRLVGSDETFFVYDGEWQRDSIYSVVTTNAMSFDCGGTVHINVNVVTGARTVYIRAYADNKVVKEEATRLLRLNVEAGKNYRFRVEVKEEEGYSLTNPTLYIGATIVQGNKFAKLV